MDFLANLEKILLSPEIEESYFQKAEGDTPHPPACAAAGNCNQAD
jgi:hypothetical protein